MNRKILVIDDEQEFVQLIKRRLETNGYSVVAAYDGAEGLADVKTEKPDLIILDVMMPNMDGYSFVRELRTCEDIKSTPIIVLTANDQLDDLFVAEGVKNYFVKPINANDLLDRIQKLLK